MPGTSAAEEISEAKETSESFKKIAVCFDIDNTLMMSNIGPVLLWTDSPEIWQNLCQELSDLATVFNVEIIFSIVSAKGAFDPLVDEVAKNLRPFFERTTTYELPDSPDGKLSYVAYIKPYCAPLEQKFSKQKQQIDASKAELCTSPDDRSTIYLVAKNISEAAVAQNKKQAIETLCAIHN